MTLTCLCETHIIAHMKGAETSPQARRREVARLLTQGEQVSTAALAERFGVSAMTIRRDLGELQRAGVAVRTHGGAVAAQRITFEFAFDERRRRHLAEKERIGCAAARLVEAGQAILLDTGTTTLQVARAIGRLATRCSVVTSSLVIASELWACEGVELMLLGGLVRRDSPDLVGPATELMLGQLQADMAFIGADALNVERGTFAREMDAARVAAGMAQHARRTVVVADSSKLTAAAPFLSVSAGQIDALVTDDAAAEDELEPLRSRGVELIRA